MKTERRHELQTNVLANSLGHWADAAKPYGRAALAVILAVIVGLLAWLYLSRQSERQLGEGWNEYFGALDGTTRDPRDTLRDLADRYAGTPVALWSRQTLADIQLNEGTNLLLTDRKKGREDLREATETYKALIIDGASQPGLVQQAMFGLARAHESLGELEVARGDYDKLVKDFPESPFADDAKKRAADLNQAEAKSFYDWLAKYEPPKPLSKEPGTPGARPDFLKEPGAGNMQTLPPLAEGAAPAGTPAAAPATEAPATETPAAPAAEGTPETPAENPAAPATEAPATEAPAATPPATEPPAAEAPAEPAPKN